MVFQKSVLKKGLYGSNGELVGGKTNKLRPARLKWSLGRGYERERERERESLPRTNIFHQRTIK